VCTTTPAGVVSAFRQRIDRTGFDWRGVDLT
jgi:hypothetical protein